MATYVLIPGAGGRAWYWHRVVPELQARGHEAIAVDLPAADDAAGLAAYAEAVVAAIGGRHDVVLVAQSMGAFTAPLVVDRVRVDQIVLVNPMIPAPSETAGDWWAATGQAAAQAAYLASIGLAPGEADDLRMLFFHDVPSDVTEEAFRDEPRQSGTPFTEPWPLDAWPAVQTRMLVGRDDRLFPLEFQRRLGRQRLGLTPDEMDGGHLVALSQPRELVERLVRYRVG